MANVYQFGPYRQDADARSLTREGTPVPITPKAFDTLLHLVSHAGRTVSREELISAVWPDAFVEDGNLNFNISQIRKLLGESAPGFPYIQTLLKQGYRFVAQVSRPNEEIAEQVAEQVEIVHAPARPPVAAADPTRKRAWIWAAAGALAVTLLGIGLSLTPRLTSPLPQPSLVPVTTYPGSEINPTFSPDGKQIAFSWDGEKGDRGNGSLARGYTYASIYVKLLGETEALRLTTSPGGDLYPTWSPDGKRIAFHRWAPGAEGDGIFTVSALGGTERRLAAMSTYGPLSWSRDGKWLAIATGKPLRIALLPVDGGELRRISNPKAPASDYAPVFAAGGHRLAYAGCSGNYSCAVYVQELDAAYAPRGNPRPITPPGPHIGSMTWSRDDGSVIYDVQSIGFMSSLWRAEADGRNPPKRLEIAGPYAFYPAVSPTDNRLVFYTEPWDADIWRYRENGGIEPFIVSSLPESNAEFSPDGTRIVFESGRSGETEEVWQAQADGSKPVQLTSHLGRHQGNPHWSPDGRWIAFDSQAQDGRLSIYVMGSDGSAPRKVTDGSSNDNVPFWSRDGKWIYFRSERTGRFELWRAPLAGGPPEQVTKNGRWTGRESVDGRTLFYTTTGGSRPVLAKPLSGGEERQVMPYINRSAFCPVADGIYFIGPWNEGNYYPLEFFRFADHSNRTLAKIDGGVYEGLSVSPDRKTILFTKSTKSGADLMMIENFQ